MEEKIIKKCAAKPACKSHKSVGGGKPKSAGGSKKSCKSGASKSCSKPAGKPCEKKDSKRNFSPIVINKEELGL